MYTKQTEKQAFKVIFLIKFIPKDKQALKIIRNFFCTN